MRTYAQAQFSSDQQLFKRGGAHGLSAAILHRYHLEMPAVPHTCRSHFNQIDVSSAVVTANLRNAAVAAGVDRSHPKWSIRADH